MFEQFIIAWFILNIHATDYDGSHNYLFVKRDTNTYVAYSSKEEIKGLTKGWNKLRMNMKCELIKEPNSGSDTVPYTNVRICNATEIEIEQCTPKNSIYINGKLHC